jgi:predicted 3-demethylubiquinone-9 3-methyltransferase (glyoxalase superfamily)
MSARKAAEPILARSRELRQAGRDPGVDAGGGMTNRGYNLQFERKKEENAMQKIVPFLWFDGKAEEAMNFYVSVFNNSRVVSVTRYGEAGPGPKGTVMSATFQLEGQDFYALNGGPQFTFTPAISLFVTCETQEEVDGLWETLSAGGRKDRCGWLQDKYGLSWQVIPSVLGRMLQDKDAEKSQRVMKAMMQMDKIDIKRLQEAYAGR